jgi:hypothetical protein
MKHWGHTTFFAFFDCSRLTKNSDGKTSDATLQRLRNATAANGGSVAAIAHVRSAEQLGIGVQNLLAAGAGGAVGRARRLRRPITCSRYFLVGSGMSELRMSATAFQLPSACFL